MGLSPAYLVDKSVIARERHEQVAQRVQPLLMAGLLATCATVELEVLYSARNPGEHEQLRADRLRAYTWIPMDDDVHLRALDVQRRLARSNRHRTVRLPDLLLAAAAETYDLAVLHYDRDFDRIAEVTGQQCEWVVPPGRSSMTRRGGPRLLDE
jgi:predicted nucleic acid-binding protein